jgi:uncharacterized membrane protein YidH (DUF202 family)
MPIEKINDEGRHTVDASLILSMERTLFAALNNAWLLAIGGIGLMSVGNDDTRATNLGIVILIGGIIGAIMAYGMHFWRVEQLKKKQAFRYSHSIFWTSMIASMTVATLILEMYFGILHPYLQREKAVTISD